MLAKVVLFVNDEQIEKIALKSGFEIEEQKNGNAGLSPLIYKFAREILKVGSNSVVPIKSENDIDTLLLTVRAENCLRAEGINTISKLLSYSRECLLKSHYIGVTSLKDIETKLTVCGMELMAAPKPARAL